MPAPARKPLMRCLGEFVGHIWAGVRHDAAADDGARVEVRRETAEKEAVAGERRVLLRRTIIDEVELKEPRA